MSQKSKPNDRSEVSPVAKKSSNLMEQFSLLDRAPSKDHSLSPPKKKKNEIRPFIKWAGGKRVLLGQFERFYPKELLQGELTRYYEPFLGGGALFFHLAERGLLRSAYLSDLNVDLILTYRVVKEHVEELIRWLHSKANHHHSLSTEKQKEHYLSVRKQFNEEAGLFSPTREFEEGWIRRAGQFIFLNKTCYGGMFRVNLKGEFNVPFGKHKRPQILDEQNLRKNAELLQIAQLSVRDFSTIEEEIDENCFVYFDPPYRPLSDTAQFTTYQLKGFGDEEQKRLALLFQTLDHRGAKIMLSNSDASNSEKEDFFFQKLYGDFYIHRVSAPRKINSNFGKRGRKSELLITNYPVR